MDYPLKIMSIEEDAQDIRRFIVVRPANFIFVPGKMALVSMNKIGLEDKKQPCSFFSINHDYYLELVLKGDQRKEEFIPFFQARPGEELILSDQVGNIEYKGPGAFIASGKGVLPFITIFKHLKKMDAIPGHTLIYIARTQEEVMYERMLKHLLGTQAVFVVGKDPINSVEARRVDESLLRQKLPSLDKFFYVAGPQHFVSNTTQVLEQLGINCQAEVVD